MNLFIYLSMLFCHILDDFCLQTPWLANGKQKAWWEKNAPDPLYRHDYLAALVIHCFSWSFMTLLPIAISRGFNVDGLFLAVFVINAVIHGVVDDMKANRHKINLIMDQGIHVIQIVVVFLILR